MHHSINGSFAIRQGKWKLVLCPGSGGWSDPKPEAARAANLYPIQLFDLEKDIGEQNNLAEAEPEMVNQLTQLLEKYINEGRSTKGIPQKNDREVSYMVD